MCADSLMGMDFKELEFRFQVADSAAIRPVNELNEKYRAQLQALAADAQTNGNLEKVLAIKSEIKRFETAQSAARSPHDDLNRLHGIYYPERRKLQSKVWEKQLDLLDAFEESIRQLQSDLTKEGDISAAVALKSELGKIEERQESLRTQISWNGRRIEFPELFAMLEGSWTFATTGKNFQIGADGVQLEIVDADRQIVRVNDHLYRLSADGTQLSGKGLEGGSRHLAKKRR